MITFAHHEWNMPTYAWYDLFGLPSLEGFTKFTTVGGWKRSNGWTVLVEAYYENTLSVTACEPHGNVRIEFLVEDGKVCQLYIHMCEDLARWMVTRLPKPSICTRLGDEKQHAYQSYSVYCRKGFSLLPRASHWRKHRSQYQFIESMNVAMKTKLDALKQIAKNCRLRVGDVIMLHDNQEHYVVTMFGFQKV